jgi:oligosaccharide reducing-end xylanase
MAKLKENMRELATTLQEAEGLPTGFKEGPYLFERRGI